MSDEGSPPGLGAIARLFLRFGATAFGGPAAHVALMHNEVVSRRGWMPEQTFLDRLGLTNLIPGPNSTELSMLIGHHLAGRWGLVVAGGSFILPAAAIVLALAYAYVHFGTTVAADAVLFGIAAVVIAVVAQALLSLTRTALKDLILAATAVTALVLYLIGVNELVVLFGLAAAVMLIRNLESARAALFVPALPILAQQAGSSVELDRLFLLFLKFGAVLFGSGYVLLAFLRGDLVERLGWLTEQQLLDAVAIGQVTPGPLFTTATFIGYVLAGLPGAVLATAGIFLPSFFFAAAIGSVAGRVRSSAWASALLDGVNAAALGLMAGVTLQLARRALADPVALLLALAAAVALFRFRLSATWVVLAGGALGAALYPLTT